MLKQQARAVAASLYAADLASTLGALAAAYLVRSEVLPRFFPERLTALYPFTVYLVLVGPIVVIWTGLLFLSGAYRSRRTSGLKDETLLIGKIVLGGTVLLTILVYGLRLDFISRPFLPLFAFFNTLFLIVERLVVRIVARKVRVRGYNFRTVVLVGDTPRARSMARLIHDHPWWGLRLLGLVRERPASSEAGTTAGGLPVLGSLEDFPTILTSLPVDEVILAVDRGDIETLEDIFLLCEEMGVKTRLILDFFPHVFAKVELEEFDGTPLLTFSTTPTETGGLIAKRVLDVGIAAGLGLVCLPFAALVAALIKVTSHGPVLFRQVRCGLNGRPFTFYKLRTMVEGAEGLLPEVAHLNEHEGPVFKASHDPRVTAFGRLLRRFSLDEIPQLWNVLKGEMSLVGPRPPLPEEVARYEKWQRRRLSMKPGLTGLWQVSGRSDLPSFDQWMELDLAYIDNWSLTLDMKILLRTIPTVLSGRGAR